LLPGEPFKKPSPLEVFWGQITCNPVADPPDELLAFQQEQQQFAAERRYVSPEEKKRMSDLDLIDQRMREAAVRRRQERKGAAEEDILGVDTVAARQRLLQEESFRKEKAQEFEEKRLLAQEEQREAAASKQTAKGFFDSVGSLDMTFGSERPSPRRWVHHWDLRLTMPQTASARSLKKTENGSTNFWAWKVWGCLSTFHKRRGRRPGVQSFAARGIQPMSCAKLPARRTAQNRSVLTCALLRRCALVAVDRFPVPATLLDGDTKRFRFVLQDKPDLTCEPPTRRMRATWHLESGLCML
jgi:hypothetical protein